MINITRAPAWSYWIGATLALLGVAALWSLLGHDPAPALYSASLNAAIAVAAFLRRKR